ncbi:hypothetical protein H6G97_04920 [Nostoc flagelliforme FACHB-838]|uniref:Uncharacterized protein n=1 Tax=Nostoc flagelliforme FACHB-838 TaxID=2692904 RepID=A0ABR8DHN4_9NOSO|nr:hypothetical protein [Nostoc flagelliforme]MBD2528946.1 hypothetical protein [Nostoc flagelliforme FACHB-838]
MITPTIKRRSLNEISLLFVSPIRVVSAVGRKSNFKGQVISQSYRIILTPGSCTDAINRVSPNS